ncbi:MAG: NUDIX domain-containing protein [Ruminococcaceae bacterium]|nr:NUDIX domain-containing protein [Oscillospiraceae bacterium]
MENINIYDASLRPKGIMDRKLAHIQGEWHITFHCWIVNKENQSILFQLRSKDKKNYPNMFDISAAGHLVANEEIGDGIREVTEELGINMCFNNLHSLGYRVEVDDQENGQKNREYQSVYIAEISKELSEYRPQKEEVSGLMWMKLVDALSLFSDRSDTAMMSGIIYDSVTNQWIVSERTVSKADFIPRIQNYYLTIAIMCQRLFNNDFPLSIS